MTQPSPDSTPFGILVVDKPAGWTSHDVVNKVRRVFNTRKVGHAGTLDPMATGVLIVLVGKATKWSDQLLVQDKAYQAEISFGQLTDTGDADGQVIDTTDATFLTQSQIEKVLPLLAGTREQQVPAYAAVKINGQKLYELARIGKVVEDRPVRTITISRLELLSFDPTPPFPTASIDVHCSKGTYIRVLAEEIAAKLSTVAHLTALRRTASGNYTLDQSVTLEALQQTSNPATYLRQLDS
jgi:tRNA pseudouridine55 synthase